MMEKHLKGLNSKDRSFFKNVLMITGATTIAQVISMIAILFISRFFTPDEYGVLVVFTAVIGAIGFFGSLNYEICVPIEKDENKAVSLVILSTIILLISCFIIGVALYFWGYYILKNLNADRLEDFWFLIPIGVFVPNLYNIFSQWAYRNRDYKTISFTKINQSLAQSLLSIIAGFANTSGIFLVLSKIVGQSFGIYRLFRPLRDKIKDDFIAYIELNNLLALSKRYKQFPLLTTPRRYLGDLSNTLPTLFISSMFGSAAVGYFGLANSIIQIPISLLGVSISNVFSAEMAKAKHQGLEEINRLANKISLLLLLLGSIPVVILWLWGPFIFGLFFGEGWTDASKYAQLLILVAYSRLILKPISTTFEVFERQIISLLLNILRVFFVFFVFLFSDNFNLNEVDCISLYTALICIVNILEYIFARLVLLKKI